MNKEELKKQIAEAEKERADLFALKDPIDKKLVKNFNQIERLRDQLAKVEIKEPKSLEEKIDYFLFEDGSISGERYNARTKFWHKFCGDTGLYATGYYHQTKQINFTIKLTYDNEKSLNDHIKQLNILLPYIKAFDGYKHFSILEHTLSRYGSYCLLIDEKTKIHNITFGGRNIFESQNLEQALKYIQNNLWYDGKEIEDEDY